MSDIQFPTMQLPSGSNSAVAFEQAKPDILLATKGETTTLNVEVSTVVRAMLTGWGNAQPYMAEVEQVGFLDLVLLKKLPTYALALGYAQALHAWTIAGPKATEALAETLKQSRRVLTTELELMVLRGLLPKDSVRLEGSTSFNSMVEDVRAIATVFLANWDAIGAALGGKSDHIEAALVAADQLVAALAQADQIQEKTKAATQIRNAAWTLAYKAHRELERAIAHLRFHEGDAEVIVPSLFVRAKGRKSADKDDKQELSPVLPIPTTPAGGGAGTAPGANTPAAPVSPSKPFA